METKTNKTNFFKKIYISLFKIKEYSLLTKDGLKKSIYYVLDILLILSLIYAGIVAFQMKKNVNGLKSYLQEKLPEFTYLEGTLTSENEETIILDNDLVKINFGGQIVIDTKTDYETLVNKYKENKQATILLTANKYTTINAQGKVLEYSYDEVLEKYLGQQVKSLDKEEVLYLFDNISYTYYFFAYALSYGIAHSLLVFAYDLLISLFAFIICKVKKVAIKFEEIYSMGLYAMTIPVICYFIINFIPASVGIYIQVISTIIPIIYLTVAIYTTKWITPEMAKKNK